ncbi:uncharacterized protein [Euphorbia lathyris]|uniref:uncharacterized protein n=1 Tax=Euphorbia lathyris TaxID=212925 RepID=UPI0033143303
MDMSNSNSNEVALKVREDNITSGNKRSNENASFIWKSKGGWKAASILLANQGLATLAFFGVGVNLVLFLTRVLGQSNAVAANSVSIWTGTVYLCSLIGAFLSDSYWGRYLTCALFQLVFVLGLVMLSISSSIFLIKPTGCGDGKLDCKPSSTKGVAVFYLSIYLVALGYGGHQPTLATFGADQFDEAKTKEKNKSSKAAFFCYFYFALNSGSLFSNTILVYFEDNGEWTLGFLISLGSAVLALASFLLATPGYRYVKPCGNPLPRVAQVFVATVRKWHVKPANTRDLYELQGSKSAIKGSRKIHHSHEIKCLDKAATITEDDMLRQNEDPWRLCTVTQVEEAKCVLKMLPIWLCTIIYSVVFTQMASLFVEQGDVMNSKIGKFHLPAASMSAFDICSVLICTGIYRQILVPLAGKLSGNPKGLTELQRMGIGLIIGMLAMLAAAATEIQRLKHVKEGQKISSLTIFWQIPQYVLVGASEVFMYVGQLEFFNEQAPDGIKSFGSSLCMASISLGNYVSSLLVNMVMAITARGESPGWIPQDLNSGHMERFYFLLAALTACDCVIYYFCARWYQPINLNNDDADEDKLEEDDDHNNNTVIERKTSSSFKDILLSHSASKENESRAKEEDFEVNEEDVVVDTNNDLPSIVFSDRIHTLMAKAMQLSVVVRLLGKRIGYKVLYNRLMSLWKPASDIKVVDLDNGYYLVKLASVEDYSVALLKGPWTIIEHYLTVQPWSPSFNTMDGNISAVATWLRFPGLPIQYYQNGVLREIAKMLGKFIKADYNTISSECGKFARMAVELDLTKSLVSQISIDGRLQSIEYEDFSIICYKCGRYVHISETCKESKGEDMDIPGQPVIQRSNDGAPANSSNITEKADLPSSDLKLGPWIHATKKRRNVKPRGPIPLQTAKEDKCINEGVTSRFQALSCLDDDSGNHLISNPKKHVDPSSSETNLEKAQAKEMVHEKLTLQPKDKETINSTKNKTLTTPPSQMSLSHLDNPIENLNPNCLMEASSIKSHIIPTMPINSTSSTLKNNTLLDPAFHSVAVVYDNQFNGIMEDLQLAPLSSSSSRRHFNGGGKSPDQTKAVKMRAKFKVKTTLAKISTRGKGIRRLAEEGDFIEFDYHIEDVPNGSLMAEEQHGC